VSELTQKKHKLMYDYWLNGRVQTAVADVKSYSKL